MEDLGGVFWLCLAALSAIYFSIHLYFSLRMFFGVVDLNAAPSPAPARWPRVSLIVPARDEALAIEGALLSKLREPYPDLELIVVDDRSTDGTSAIVDRLAAEHPRIRAIHIRELPAGWLGKVHALDVGTKAASGELILLSDADVHIEAGTLEAVVARAELEGADVVGVWPRFLGVNLWIDAGLVAASRQIFGATRAWAASDPASSASLGVGAFTLVRKSALERIGGFAALRLEVSDDVGLAQLIKRETRRALAFRAGPSVSLTMYPTMQSYLRGAEKGAVIVNFSAFIATALALAMVIIECAPLVLVAFEPTRALALVAIAGALLSSALAAHFSGFSLLRGLVWPIGALVNAFALARCGVRAAAQQGMSWRDTFYSAQSLRAGRKWRVL
ncbi:MAG: glycosyltransferase family 2 protein [Myxococcota bacterium]